MAQPGKAGFQQPPTGWHCSNCLKTQQMACDDKAFRGCSFSLRCSSQVGLLLSQLGQAGAKLDKSCFHSVALLHGQLQLLNLDNTNIDATALSQLTSVPWPCLQYLWLGGNKLTADAIAILVLAEMPNMVGLNLVNNQLDAAAAWHLAGGNWPKLQRLILQENEFEDYAMACLADGHWPNLQLLMLHDKDISL